MLRLAAAHTDHPCLYIKSNPEVDTKGYGKLNVEVYGGAILNTWMDRAHFRGGKSSYQTDNVFEPGSAYCGYETSAFYDSESCPSSEPRKSIKVWN